MTSEPAGGPPLRHPRLIESLPDFTDEEAKLMAELITILDRWDREAKARAQQRERDAPQSSPTGPTEEASPTPAKSQDLDTPRVEADGPEHVPTPPQSVAAARTRRRKRSPRTPIATVPEVSVNPTPGAALGNEPRAGLQNDKPTDCVP